MTEWTTRRVEKTENRSDGDTLVWINAGLMRDKKQVEQSYLEYFNFYCRRMRRLSAITAIFIVVHLNLGHFSLC